MSFDVYNSYLTSNLIFLLIELIIVICTTSFFGYLLIKTYKKSSRDNTIACCIGEIISILVLLVIVIYSIPMILDIKNQSYIKIEEEFYVESISDTGIGCTIRLRNLENNTVTKYNFMPNPDYLTEGYHKGYIIYSKRSKIICEWYCSECSHS